MNIRIGMPTTMIQEEESMAALRSYKAYFLSTSDHIRYVRAVKALDHLSASAQAEAMLRESDYATVEIYEGWRLVTRMNRTQQAA
ncbi:MAG TPA: hypothetical protein VFE34_00930 [Dongiaceae bacterium]|nr:hypothetical protein [Dongiaceae bacterium]